MERAKITEPYGYINKPFDNIEIETAIQLAVSKTNNSG
jgi:AmiR/NasT family two-component response regulator